VRPIERIDILSPLLLENVNELIHKIPDLNKYIEVESTITVIEDNWEDIIESWKENQDLRFFQLLIMLEYIPNIPGSWFYIEEDQWLIKNKLAKSEDILLWGNNYDVDNVRLPETIWKPISSLNTSHIQAILNGKFTKNPLYIKTFNKVLKSRGKKVINIKK